MASSDVEKQGSGLSVAIAGVAGVVAVGAAVFGHVANSLIDASLTRLTPEENADLDKSVGSNLSPAAAAAFMESQERSEGVLTKLRAEWLPNVEVERVVMPSADGVNDMAGFIYPAAKESKRWVVLVHGYRGEHREMEGYGAYYARRGFNVFAPDLVAHGESEGRYIGMGGSDRFDALLWIDYLLDRFGDDSEIVVHGHSMGAATALMAAGEGLPPQVKAVVSDCAYTSAWQLFEDILVSRHIPPHPMLEAARIVLKIRNGQDIKSVNVAHAVARSATPTLFLHGGADSFVPATMSVDLYACSASRIKELHIIPSAGHIESFPIDADAYFAYVDSFLTKAGLPLS